MNKLFKNRAEKMLTGVCAGIGDYVGLDATVIRVIWSLLTIFSACFPGIILYVVLALIMPNRPEE